MGVGKPLPLPVPSPTSPIPVPDLPVATTTQTGDRVQSARSPSETADWRVSQAGGDFVIDLPAARGQVLTVAGDGTVIMRDRAAAGTRGRWAFVPRGGCPAYPEIPLDVSGAPRVGTAPWSAVHGLIDGHMHMMAFEFLGGRVHCGRPWQPYGVPVRDASTAPTTTRTAPARWARTSSPTAAPRTARPGRLADLQGLAVARTR